MLGSRIFWKLYGAFFLVILVAAGTVYAVAGGRIEDQVVEQISNQLATQATLLSDLARSSLAGEPDPAVQARIRDLGRATDTRFTIIRADGVVLADSWEQPERMENHAHRPEVLEAGRTGHAATASRMSRTVKERMLYLAEPVYRDSRLLGFVRAALPLVEVEHRRSFLRRNVTIGLVVAAALALLLGLFLTRAFTRPLANMTRLAQAIAAGEYDRRVPAFPRDEIGRLGDSLVEMSGQLRERMEALQVERNELRAILASMLEGVVAVDHEERIVHMNDIAARFLSTSAEECVGQRVWEVTRIEEVQHTVASVLEDGAEHTREVRIARGHQDRDLELRASPMRMGPAGKFGAVLVLHDVTELRHLETVRRDFVANVSHELKTPLTAIRGFIETLLDDPGVDEATRQRFLTRVRDQTLRLSTLVADLLVLSRVESEAQAIERKPLDLRAPLRDSVRRLTADLSKRDLDFAAALPEPPVEVVGDEEALRQVADNLLDNAFKYTPDGGRVRVRLTEDAGYAVLEVEDTGIGVEAKDVGRIFERFYRVDKARSRELGGTGLGLSIVKHIVEAHQGRVSVKSSPGQGSAFRVEIPLRRVESPAA